MTLKKIVVFSLVLAIAPITSASPSDEAWQTINSISDEIEKLISISKAIEVQHEPTISANSTEIQRDLQLKVNDTLNVVSSIKNELSEFNYNVPDLKPIENKIISLPHAYALNYTENSNTAVTNKILEIEQNKNDLTVLLSHLKENTTLCNDNDDNCFTLVLHEAEEILKYVQETVKTAENYSFEIEIYLTTEKINQLKLGEKELSNLSFEVRRFLFQEPITVVIGPLEKNITEIKSETDKLIGRYTINLLVNYSTPIDEALDNITSDLNRYKSILELKNNTLHEENESKSSEIQKCLENFNKFDEFLAENVTKLRGELMLCTSTFNKKINLHSAKSKQLTNKIRRYLDKIAVLDLKSFDDLETAKSDCVDNLSKFHEEFNVYNDFEGDLEEYRNNFASIIEENNFNKQAEDIFTKASECLDGISAGINLASFTLLIMALITIVEIL